MLIPSPFFLAVVFVSYVPGGRVVIDVVNVAIGSGSCGGGISGWQGPAECTLMVGRVGWSGGPKPRIFTLGSGYTMTRCYGRRDGRVDGWTDFSIYIFFIYIRHQ